MFWCGNRWEYVLSRHNTIFHKFYLYCGKYYCKIIIYLKLYYRMRNIRSLSVSRLNTHHLSKDDFNGFGLELEDLKINGGSIQTIKSHAFMHVRGIKRLDLSENKISQFEVDAFKEVGHSLLALKMSSGLAESMSALPADAMRPLTSLQQFDVTNNHLKTLSDTVFHFLKNLRVLDIHDNRIDQVLKGTFQVSIQNLNKCFYYVFF